MNTEQTLTSEPGPRPFAEIPPLWLRPDRMTETFLSGEQPRASTSNTFFAVLVTAVIGMIASAAVELASGVFGAEFSGMRLVLLACYGFLVTPFAFYVSNAIYLVGAKVLGGKGTYKSQAYLTSLYFVPLMTLSWIGTAFALIPAVGPYLSGLYSFGLGLWQLVLNIRTLKVVHGFSSGRSLVAILAPTLLLLIPICVIAVLMIMGPAIGNTFSTINTQLGTPGP